MYPNLPGPVIKQSDVWVRDTADTYIYGADVDTERTVKATFHNIMIRNYLVVTDLNGDNKIEEYFQSNT